MTDRLTRRRLLATAAQAPLLAAAAQLPLVRRAQAQIGALPADAQLDALYSNFGLIVASLGAVGGIMLPIIEAQRLYMQSAFWNYRLMADDAFMTAWMTASLADQDKNVRMATAGGRRAYELIDQDIAWWRDNFNRIMIPNAQLSAPERAAKEKHDALVELRAELDRVQLKPLADRIEAVFDRARNALVRMGGGQQAARVANLRELVTTMNEFARVAVYVDGLLPAVKEFGWPLTRQQWQEATQPAPAAGGGAAPPPASGPTAAAPAVLTTPQRRPVVPYAGQQVRLAFENTSTNLIFFVRLQSVQRDRSYQMRTDTQHWLPIYPKDATMPRAGSSDPRATQATEERLPNTLWLPSKPADRLELRVATYGEHRKRIRWLVVRGQQVRLAIDGLSRGFYWLHYELRRSDAPGDLLTQILFPTRESYQWQLNGLWEGAPPTGAAWTATPINTLRAAPPETYPLALERDYLVWTLPTGMETIRNGAMLRAAVTGNATYTRIGPTARQRVDNLTETGSGALVIEMAQW